MKKIRSAGCRVVIALTLCFAMVTPASAASIDSVLNRIYELQDMLNKIPSGMVLGSTSYVQTIEAETGELESPMAVEGDFITTTKAKQGTAQYEITVPEDGKYTIEFKVLADAKTRSQIKLSVNDSNHRTMRFYDENERDASVWKSNTDSRYVVDLEAGSHILEIEARDRDIMIDAFRVVSNSVSGSESADDSSSEEVIEDTSPNEDVVEETVEESEDITTVAPQEPATGVDYEALLNNVVGFGQGTTGGKDGDVCRVTTLSDSGNGSLRDCATKGDTWVVFDVSGTISLRSPLRIANDTTIDGRGADILITNRGLSTAGRENIIIHNLKIDDINGDGIAVYEAKNIWIDHVTVGNTSDGAIDITKQSYNVTVSWSHLKDQNKTMLIGANNSHTEDERITVTLHHNWYDNTTRRNPLIRFGSLHMYNNLLTDWGTSGGGDGVNAVYGARVLLENNVFEAGGNTMAVRTTVPNYMEVPGYIKARGNLMRNGAAVFSAEPEKVFEASDKYAYRLKPATNDLAGDIRAYAGWQPSSFFSSSPFREEAQARQSDGSTVVQTLDMETSESEVPTDVATEPTEEQSATTESTVNGNSIIIEAELGTLESPMVQEGGHVFTPDSREGTATYRFTTSEAGEYQIELKVKAPSRSSDSVFLKVNNNDEDTLHLFESAEVDDFAWKTDDAYEVDLPAGTHTLVLRGRESNTLIDAIRITALSGNLKELADPVADMPSTGPVDPVADLGSNPDAGKKVVTTDVLNVRATAAGALLGSQPVGASGVILATPAIQADGYTWVQVNFDSGVDGYVADSFLSVSLAPTAPVGDEPSTGPVGPGDMNREQLLEMISQLVALIAALQLSQ